MERSTSRVDVRVLSAALTLTIPSPAEQVVSLTPVPPWAARGSKGVTLTRDHFWQLSTQYCNVNKPWRRRRLTDEVVNSLLELEETWCKQRGDNTTLILSSFFVTRLGGTRGEPYCFERVRRWHAKSEVALLFNSVLHLRLIPVIVPFNEASKTVWRTRCAQP